MAETATDIPANDWIDRKAPRSLRPYLRLARLDRPIGTWLLLLPCWWGVSLAGPFWPDPWLLLLFAIGAVVMRGAGCTLNDIIDRDIDAQVARTAIRPLPSGALNVRQAVAFFILQCFIGLAVLTQLNAFSIGLGIASLGVVAAYPFMKRITYWPQAVLGLAFNWGALLGWSALTGRLDLAPLLLYAGGVSWTLAYDTIYAHQDKSDDVRVGVKSTALLLGSTTKRWLVGFFGTALVLFAAAGVAAGAAGPALFAALAAAGGHALWQVLCLDLDDPRDCLAKFRSNRDFGLIVLAGIVLGRITG
ncbi:MAG: 4-hydroxybenzoate octaprenyltransferase [Rhodospirillales bacterium]|jgi:4-hydroxybenzoate polyprenyltransferase|nr:4-hydroxybenzoate octaprenyltransferase [Rhodospirillales bacterium]